MLMIKNNNKKGDSCFWQYCKQELLKDTGKSLIVADKKSDIIQKNLLTISTPFINFKFNLIKGN